MCSQFSGMCSQLPRAVLPKLWGWGSRCVCAGCYCSASEWLKIAVTIAMATGAVSLCCEGAAWMLELPWWIPGRWRRFWWGLLGAEVIQPKCRLVLTPVRMCLDRESLATVGGSGVGCDSMILISWKMFLDIPVLYLHWPWGTGNLRHFRY